MPLRLRILAGPSLDQLTPIEHNSDKPLDVKSDAYEGRIAVYIKGLDNASRQAHESSYFSNKRRANVTWSIQAQGRFLQPYSANDVMFGNIFDYPLKLPWGFGAALTFMQYLDPTLEQDLTSQSKPWALSPLISTMPYLAHTLTEEASLFPPTEPVEDNMSELIIKDENETKANFDPETTSRQSYFKSAVNRDRVIFGPKDMLTTDFCYNYLHFSPDGVTLRIPGGISFDMMDYWDGQPVRFVCCERKRTDDKSNVPWGRVFWCVSIEMASESDGDGQENEID